MGELTIPALTVRQPWASLIVHGPKWIETRTRRTNVRGRIGIIAGAHPVTHGTTVGAWAYASLITGGALYDGDPVTGRLDKMPCPFGALIGTVELYDCVPIIDGSDVCPAEEGPPPIVPCVVWDDECGLYQFHGDGSNDLVDDQLPYGDFTPGRWAWLLRNPRPLAEPIPMKGALGWQTITIPDTEGAFA